MNSILLVLLLSGTSLLGPSPASVPKHIGAPEPPRSFGVFVIAERVMRQRAPR